MKVRYKIGVDHEGESPPGVKFVIDGILFRFEVESGRLQWMTLEVSNFPLACVPKFEMKNGVQELTIPPDPIWDDVESRLMVVEGIMSLFGLKQFNFEDRTTEWIPESEEEKAKIDVFSFQASSTPNTSKLPVLYDMFARSALVSRRFAAQETALNFGRRGREDIVGQRYIDAIYDFYFAIETLFAEGAFRKTQVLQRMRSNSELMKAIAQTKDELASDVQFIKLQDAKGAYDYLKQSPFDIVERIFDLRGFLHHHSAGHPSVWHPARQRAFRIDAVFLHSLVGKILLDLTVGAMYSDETVAAFKAIRITTLDGNPVAFKPIEL